MFLRVVIKFKEECGSIGSAEYRGRFFEDEVAMVS